MPSGQTIDRNIFRRRNGIYYVRWTDASGVQRVKSTRTKELRHARALLAKLQAEAFERREFPGRKKNTLTAKQLRDLAIRHLDAQRRSRDHRRHLDAAVEWFGPQRYVSTLTFAEAADYRDHLAKKPNGKPRSIATVNSYLIDLLTALNHAVDAGSLERNPLHGFELQDPRNERDRVSSTKEYKKLLHLSESDPDLHLAIVIGFNAPMRLGEIAAVTRDRVFLRERFLALGEAQTKNSEGRLVPLSKPVVVAMSKFLKRFPERTGRLLRPELDTVTKAVRSLSKAFARIADKARCPDLRFHDLKHTSLTNYRRSGMDFSQMQKISGNKTIALLVKRYQKVVDDELLAAVDRAARRNQ